MGLSVSVVADQEVEFHLSGGVTSLLLQQTDRELQNLPQSFARLVIDLSQADLIDSTGLGLLVYLREEATQKGTKTVAIRGARGRVESVLAQANFHLLFEFV